MTEQEFLDLLNKSESATLDFKSEAYRLSEDWSQAALIKDVLCMANTPREETSHIVLGVKKHADGHCDLVGLNAAIDGNDLQTQFVERVYPIPCFAYETFAFQSKLFGIISIPPVRQGPCVPIRDFGKSASFLRQRQVYLRRDSTNDLAAPDDLHRIVAWIQSGKRPVTEESNQIPAWTEFLQAVRNFDSSRRFFLLASPVDANESSKLRALGKAPWIAVFDFDPNSDTQGALAAMKTELEAGGTLHLVALGDRPNINVGRSTYWVFARGLTGRDRSLETGGWLAWQRKYGAELAEQMRRFATAISPTPITCVVLWNQPSLLQHLQSTLNTAVGAFGDSIHFVVVTTDPASIQATVAPFEATVVDISPAQLSSGIQSFFGTQISGEFDNVLLPSRSGVPTQVDAKLQRWLEEELELVHLNVGLVRPKSGHPGLDFLRGNEITWFELGIHDDVERDVTANLKKQLLNELKRGRTTRVNLYHAPGAGGSTIARRIMWDLHKDLPCVLLNHTTPVDTVQRLSQIASLTETSLLVLVDGSKIAEREVDELYDFLRGQNVAAILLQVLRRFSPQTEKQRSFYLRSELSPAEAERFVEVFGRQAPSKKQKLEALRSSAQNRICTAFYFGLETFGHDFLGLDSYVQRRIHSLTETQKRMLGFVSLAHHYAQRPLPANAFAGILGVPKSRAVQFTDAFPPETRELLIEVEKGVWRTAHDLVALEILQQLLWPIGDRRVWRQNLSRWAIDFAEFCRGDDGVPSETMLEIARRAFIYRDNAELLGTERAATPSFSQLIEDIPVQEGALEVNRKLVELFPEEAHFWAHLGRFCAVRMRDYTKALEYIERAIALQGEDHVLHHMRGMALRQQVYELVEASSDLGKAILLARESSSAFEKAREFKSDDEHGFISEVQLLAKLIDYAGQKHPAGVVGYMISPNADPYLRDCLERAEDLLEQVRRNREGEGASQFEQDCRAKLDALYGRHDDALQKWDSLLGRQDVYRPPVRRQIVWAYLARRERSWDALSEREISRIVALLEENLRQEPNDDRNLRLWVQAIRRAENPPTTESVIEKVAYWKANSNSLDAVYYLYVFHALRALDGSQLNRETALRYLEECRTLARFRRNRTKSLEWLGAGTGIKRLVHQSRLGEWQKDKEFWERPQSLERVAGRIAKIQEPQSGQIEVEGGLSAFFVPAKGGYFRNQSENQNVSFYLGFSYDGLRAWEVKDAQSTTKA